ncbi:methylated-DNA--[protein]-cysteine S-methyltransferase [Corynebacterium amycolatum]|uniref:Methylated-DNA--protein-cysteine methyltransferase n=1 Tax=Corynebacterium amycolatum TaxID=43765 RepID=A0AB37GJI1_CORAY|nr:methylated-DNA--[protein]-cysteine S-methyltransferase [Corynebacterium amycolatum]QPR31406.1 methylated-DNA--[protein]-cysteine S-methyltransferase [Corynebacterium amycolatum]QQB83285.1 methylated-DNA--[protein]-cysteine S-methyltransferase [Corynebacterium amycolatum]
MAISQVETPFGVLGIATSARGVVEVNLLGPVLDDDPSAADPEAQAVAEQAAQQFREYFAGQRREFALPLDCDIFTQDSFRARALTALRDVPYGQVVTYGELAEMTGSPRAARAAGSACATNPLGILIPCHRVVPASGGAGSFGSYAGGREMKRWLLELEGWQTVIL